MKYLGIANSWEPIVWTKSTGSAPYYYVEKEDTTPDEYKKCRQAGHKTRETEIGHQLYRVYCDECNIYWEYDCSG